MARAGGKALGLPPPSRHSLLMVSHPLIREARNRLGSADFGSVLLKMAADLLGLTALSSDLGCARLSPPPVAETMTWYFVFCGRQPELFQPGKECHDQVNGYAGACPKSYRSKEALEAFQHHHHKTHAKLGADQIKQHKKLDFSFKDMTILVQGLIILVLIWLPFM